MKQNHFMKSVLDSPEIIRDSDLIKLINDGP